MKEITMIHRSQWLSKFKNATYFIEERVNEWDLTNSAKIMTTFMILFISFALKKTLLCLWAEWDRFIKNELIMSTRFSTWDIRQHPGAIVPRRECGDNFSVLSQIYLSRELVCRAAARIGRKEGRPIINSPFSPCARQSRGRIQSASISFRTCEIAGAASRRR